ncbi:MAG: hypothetical protein GY946_29190 [bacterium]|nr:hypothetical protein [bacterium]
MIDEASGRGAGNAGSKSTRPADTISRYHPSSCTGPEYVRLYSKTVVLGPDPDGLHKERGHAIRVLRLYVHDFVYEDGAWKFHLYFDV